MCEVAILSTEKHSIEEIGAAAMTLYKSMRTSLGVVSVANVGGEYQYEVYKSLNPELENVENFISEFHDDAVRFILHGRLATHGTHEIEGAHPIQIECSECDVNYVVHNGIVRGHEQLKHGHEANGHNFRTEVDSEVIAHEYGETPANVDEIEQVFDHEPCYILMQEDRILIHAGRRYELTERGRLAQSRREFGPDEGNYKDLIMEPVQKEMEVPA